MRQLVYFPHLLFSYPALRAPVASLVLRPSLVVVPWDLLPFSHHLQVLGQLISDQS